MNHTLSQAQPRGRNETAKPETFVSDQQLAARYGIHRTTPWRWISTRQFPKPVSLTPGCTRWRLSDIEAWEAQRAQAAA